MHDIVRRLKQGAYSSHEADGGDVEETYQWQAAVEIERLTKAVQRSYGMLWRDMAHPSPLVKSAREHLRDTLDERQKFEGVAWATTMYGPVTDGEVLP